MDGDRLTGSLLGLLIALVAVCPVIAADQGPEAFLGTWEGVWTGGFLETALVVEKIVENKAMVIYRWGTSANWGIRQPGESRYEAQFLDNETLKLETLTPSGHRSAEVTYILNPDGTLSGKYVNRLGIFSAILKKK